MKLFNLHITTQKEVTKVMNMFHQLNDICDNLADERNLYKSNYEFLSSVLNRTPDIIANTEWPINQSLFTPVPGTPLNRVLKDVYDEELEIKR